MRLLRSRRLFHALIAVAFFIFFAGLYRLENAGRAGRTLSNLEYWFRDSWLTVRGRLNPPDSRLVFLGIDNASRTVSSFDLETVPPDSREHHALTLMMASPQLCWSREVYALLCERLLAAGAKAVLFDIVFDRPGEGDGAFQSVLQKFPDQIVLGSEYKTETVGSSDALRWNLPSITLVPKASAEHSLIGYIQLQLDFDGIFRKAQYQATLEQLEAGILPGKGVAVPSAMALRAATKLQPVELTQPFQRRLFRYAGPPGTFPYKPMYWVFLPDYWQQNLAGGKTFEDKVVMVGAYGSLYHDEQPTPFGSMPGPEIHLNEINALLHHEFLQELPPWADDLLIALAACVAWLLTIVVKRMWLRAVAFVLLIAGYLFSVRLAYDHADTVVLAIPPVLAFGVACLVSFVYDFTHERLEKLRIRRTLEAYVSKDVVREVLDNPESYLSKLGGERESVALIMTDLRGFTTMSEEMDSTQLVAQLNEYLSVMVDDIFSRRGSVDKFVGDAILAVWGHVKSEGPAHDATLAVEAALLMRESLKRLNADWQKRGLRTFEMGCGVNFGEVIFGNIGSARKMEPTVIGDAVNTTSRLEGLTKDYGRDLLLGETAADLVEDTYRLQFVDRVTMKGKTKPVRIYSVVSRLDAVLDPKIAAYLEAYELAHVSYSAGRLPEAFALFEKCVEHAPGDALLQVYLERCKELIERPSEGAWTGVHVAEHK